MTTGAVDWANQSGDVWTRWWRETDAGLAGLAVMLDADIAEAAPRGPFRALDVGCGPGTTSAQLARSRPDAAIIACDISPSLAALAQDRLKGLANAEVVLGDAQEVARREGPFDLIFSRHGVMFFRDPVSAFRDFRAAAAPAASLLFSCFRDWRANPWASDLSDAVAGRSVPPPGREPGGFAFSDADDVGQMLRSAGWSDAEAQSVDFDYVVGGGARAIDAALDFFTAIGPAARILQELPTEEKEAARERMRSMLAPHHDGESVRFPASAWIWRARAGQ